MPKYDYVFLDADETLFDFSKAQQVALYKMLAQLGIRASEETLQLYSAINQSYWHALERGEVSKRELGVRRFQDLFASLGIHEDPDRANLLYQASLSEADYLLEGASEACALLAEHCTLVIVTNGMVATQRRRVEKSTISRYITHLIISEDAGAAKPDRRIFEHAFQVCGAVDPSRVIMVGDSLSADIKGAIDYGIDACWINRMALPVPADWAITAVITGMAQLPEIVLGQP